MKKMLALLAAICLLTLASALADILPLSTATPLPGYTLRADQGEIRVYGAMNLKANIVGYISPDSYDEVEILEIRDDWCHISFVSGKATAHGFIPLSCFEQPAPATPTPEPQVSYAAGEQAWICNAEEGYRLNLRQDASPTAKSLGKYYTGTPITLTGQVRDGYAQVLLAGTTMGWVDLRFVTTDPLGFVPETPTVTVKNRDSGANLRSGPSTNYNRLGWYQHGTQVVLLGVRADGWCHVIVDDKVGFISDTLLSGVLPFDYGTDSDDPLLDGTLSGGETVVYLNTRASGGQVHLRKEASTSAKSVGLFYTGTPVTVISYTRTGWAYVRIGQTEGYMAADYLASAKPLQCGEQRVIHNQQTDGLNFRSQPSTGSEVLAYLANFTEVTVLGELSDGWCYVLYGEQYGYMLGTSLEKTK